MTLKDRLTPTFIKGAKILLWTYVPALIINYIAYQRSWENDFFTGEYKISSDAYKPTPENMLWGTLLTVLILIGTTKFNKLEFKFEKKQYINPKKAKENFEKTVRDDNGLFLALAYIISIIPLFLGAHLIGISLSLLIFAQIVTIRRNQLTAKFIAETIEQKTQPNAPSSSSDYGTARLATREEFAKVNFPDKDGNGLWLGAAWLRSQDGGLLTVAPPGSGKGACIIVPNLLIIPNGSYVVTDPKGELACITARAQKYGHEQKVYIIDPWDVQREIGAIHGIAACGFNPFDMLRENMEDLPDNCQMIAGYLVPVNPQAREPYWQDRARTIIKNFLVHIITALPKEEQNFWTLYKMLRADDKEMGAILDAMRKNTAYEGLVKAAAGEIFSLMRAEQTFGSIMSEAHNGTSIFESTKLRAALLKSEFNPYELPNGNVTLYIVMPERYMQSHAAFTKIIIGLCAKAINSRPGKRVNFLLDEAGNMLGQGFQEDISRLYSFGRGQNIVPWTFWQGFGQIERLHGAPFLHEITGLSKVIQGFGLGNDRFSQEKISALLGSTTKSKDRNSTSINAEGEESTSYSQETYDQPLLNPEQVGQEMHIITITDGTKYIIPRWPYYDYPDEGWRKIFDDLSDPPPRI